MYRHNKLNRRWPLLSLKFLQRLLLRDRYHAFQYIALRGEKNGETSDVFRSTAQKEAPTSPTCLLLSTS